MSSTITVDARLLGRSGIGTYLQQLLPRVIGSNPDITFNLLVPRATDDAKSLAENANVRLVGTSARLYSAGEQLVLPAVIPRETDLHWAPHYVIPLAWRGRLLVTVHDLCHLALPDHFGAAHRRLYATTMFRAVRRRARRILVVSDFTRREFHRLVGAPRGRLEVIPNGVDERWFSATPERNPEPPTPYFVYLGNIKPHKNLRTLLAAFERVAPEIPHRLVLVGASEGLLTADEEVTRMAKRMGERVQLTGYLEEERVRAVVAGAAALVFPSLYEGFGLPPLEAMAAGRPVLASSAASIPEVCGPWATYFDPADVEQLAAALRAAANDPPSSDRLEGARRHAASYTWDAAADRTSRALRETLAKASE